MSKQAKWLKNFMSKFIPKGLKPLPKRKGVNKSLHEMNLEILNKVYDMKPGKRRSRLVNQVRRNINEKPLTKEEQRVANEMIKRRQAATKRKRDAADRKRRINLEKLRSLPNVNASDKTIEDTVKRNRPVGAPWWGYNRGSKKQK